jgi:hypothetical protein
MIDLWKMGGECSTHGIHMLNAYRFLVGKTERKTHLKDIGVDERIILKWVLEESGEVWTGLI